MVTGVERSPSASVRHLLVFSVFKFFIVSLVLKFITNIIISNNVDCITLTYCSIKPNLFLLHVAFFFLCHSSGFLWRPRYTSSREKRRQGIHLPVLCLIFLLPTFGLGGLCQALLPVWWHLEWHSALMHRYVMFHLHIYLIIGLKLFFSVNWELHCDIVMIDVFGLLFQTPRTLPVQTLASLSLEIRTTVKATRCEE